MMQPTTRAGTGDEALDHALGGGIRLGSTLLVEGLAGSCSTEFAFTLLRAAGARGKRATFCSALRSPARVNQEFARLFPNVPQAPRIVPLGPQRASEHCAAAAAEMELGGILVLESAAALDRALPAGEIVPLVRTLGESVDAAGAILVLLHSPGSLPGDREASLGELADGVFTFGIREGSQSHRRSLTIRKLRGLAPALQGESIPVFEARLQPGVGVSVTSVKSVV